MDTIIILIAKEPLKTNVLKQNTNTTPTRPATIFKKVFLVSSLCWLSGYFGVIDVGCGTDVFVSVMLTVLVFDGTLFVAVNDAGINVTVDSGLNEDVIVGVVLIGTSKVGTGSFVFSANTVTILTEAVLVNVDSDV